MVLPKQEDKGYDLIYIDKHLIHEVTSPQAFEGLRNAERSERGSETSTSLVSDRKWRMILVTGESVVLVPVQAVA